MMKRHVSFALAIIWVSALFGCAGGSGVARSELDASQLVRTEPADLRVIDLLPRGIGSTGDARLTVDVADDDPRVAVAEEFELAKADERYEADEARTVVTYVLRESDHTRFAQAMVRLRAQMIAGYGRVAIGASTGVCDEAGVSLARRSRAPTVIQNAATGRTILSLAPARPTRDIKRDAPYCL